MQYNGDLDLANIDPKWLYFLKTSQINLNFNQSICVLFKIKFTHICILREMILEATQLHFPGMYMKDHSLGAVLSVFLQFCLGPVSSHRPAADH